MRLPGLYNIIVAVRVDGGERDDRHTQKLARARTENVHLSRPTTRCIYDVVYGDGCVYSAIILILEEQLERARFSNDRTLRNARVRRTCQKVVLYYTKVYLHIYRRRP